jgi:hypothetical protein
MNDLKQFREENRARRDELQIEIEVRREQRELDEAMGIDREWKLPPPEPKPREPKLDTAPPHIEVKVPCELRAVWSADERKRREALSR